MSQNDEIFLKWAKQLGEKIVQRREEKRKMVEAMFAPAYWSGNTIIHHPMTTTTNAHTHSLYGAFASEPIFINLSEKDIILAYASGEEILTTILAQER